MTTAEKQTQLAELERQLRKTTPGTKASDALQAQIQKLEAQQAATTSTPLERFRQISHAYENAEDLDPVVLCESYLNWLRCETGEFSLSGIDIRSAAEGDCQHLDDIYTALLTVSA